MIIGISGKKQSGKDTVAKMIQYISYVEDEMGGRSRYSFQDYLDGKMKKNLSKWQIKKFASKLKEVASVITGLPLYYFEDDRYKKQKLEDLVSVEWKCWKVYDSINKTELLYSTLEEAENDWNGRYYYEPREHSLTLRELLQYIGTDLFRDIIHPDIWVLSLFAEYKQEEFDKNAYALNDMKVIQPNWIISDVRFPNEANAIKKHDGTLIRIEKNLDYYDPHPSETSLDDYKDFDYVINNNGTIEELFKKIEDIYKYVIK